MFVTNLVIIIIIKVYSHLFFKHILCFSTNNICKDFVHSIHDTLVMYVKKKLKFFYTRVKTWNRNKNEFQSYNLLTRVYEYNMVLRYVNRIYNFIVNGFFSLLLQIAEEASNKSLVIKKSFEPLRIKQWFQLNEFCFCKFKWILF